MADKFDVRQLKLLAKEKFSEHAGIWPIPDLTTIVQQVLTSTPQTDRGLRDILVDIFANHVDSITASAESVEEEAEKQHRQLLSMLAGEGEFMLEVLCETVSQMDSLRDQARHLKTESNNLKTTMVARGARMAKAVKNRGSCNYCARRFQPAIAGFN